MNSNQPLSLQTRDIKERMLFKRCGLNLYLKLTGNGYFILKDNLEEVEDWDIKHWNYKKGYECINAIILNIGVVHLYLNRININLYEITDQNHGDAYIYFDALSKLFEHQTALESIVVRGYINTKSEDTLFKLLSHANVSSIEFRQMQFHNEAAFKKFATLSPITKLIYTPQYPTAIRLFKNLTDLVPSYLDQSSTPLTAHIYNLNQITSLRMTSTQIILFGLPVHITDLSIFFDTDLKFGKEERVVRRIGQTPQDITKLSFINHVATVDSMKHTIKLFPRNHTLEHLSIDVHDAESMRVWGIVLPSILTYSKITNLSVRYNDVGKEYVRSTDISFLQSITTLLDFELVLEYSKLDNLEGILEFVASQTQLQSLTVSAIPHHDHHVLSKRDFFEFYQGLVDKIIISGTLQTLNLAFDIEGTNESRFVGEFARISSALLGKGIKLNGIAVERVVEDLENHCWVNWAQNYEIYTDGQGVDYEILLKTNLKLRYDTPS